LNESMLWVVGAGVTLILVITGITALRRKNQEVGAPWPVYAKRLLGEREQVLYWRLVGAFPEHVVLAQVSLSQLIGVQKGTTNRQAVLNRFRQLCADFVICERNFVAVGVVELDGLSHDHPRKADADLRKTQALQAAGLTIVRVNVADLPDEAMLRAMIQITNK
jgi:very-short-patch-repair endonuclease